MYFYYALKRLSRQHGHTYVKRSRLEDEALVVRANYQPSSKARDGIAPVDWSPVLDFLEDWHVIVRENDGTHVFLHRYWNAEKKIAEAFHKIKKWHEVDPWTFEINREKYACTHLFTISCSLVFCSCIS